MKQILFAFLFAAVSISIQAQSSKKKVITTEQIIKQTQPEAIPEDSSSDKTQSETTPKKTDEINDLKRKMEEVLSRIDLLEGTRKNDLTEKQRKLLWNIEILSKAEGRAEFLRQRLLELTEKESTIRSRLNEIEIESTDETINRSVALIGGLRTDVLREQKRKALNLEKENLLNLLTQIQNHKLSLQESITKADALVEKLRMVIEAEIEEALTDKNN
jgi:hypothetical protein